MRHSLKNINHLFDWKKLYKEKKQWNNQIIQDLRSNHAGETGAVYIYKGAKTAVKMSPFLISRKAVRFTINHLQTEKTHLKCFDRLLDKKQVSKLLPLWKMSGFCLGFFSTFFFLERGLFITIVEVETFVEKHYLDQIKKHEKYPHTLKLLNYCCKDEIHHKEEAEEYLKNLNGNQNQRSMIFWRSVIQKGSSFAVWICKKI